MHYSSTRNSASTQYIVLSKENEWNFDTFTPFLNHIMPDTSLTHNNPWFPLPTLAVDWTTCVLISGPLAHLKASYLHLSLRLATRILTYCLSCLWLFSYHPHLPYLSLNYRHYPTVVMIQGIVEELIFFVDVPTINSMKEVFFSQIQLETVTHID